MSSTEKMKFGELYLAFTCKFEKRWNDEGSGAYDDVGFWHPIPPDGFHALGSVAVPNHHNINDKVAALCVQKAGHGDSVLAKPIDYELIWKDKGSGADKDGSCWRPIAPDGYVALGDVFVKGYSKPSKDDIRCVRADLTYSAQIGDRIWKDSGSSADHDFDAYELVVEDAININTKSGLFAPNTFVGNNKRGKPEDASVIHCLNLPMPYEHVKNIPQPKLESTQQPEDTVPVLNQVVYVPFTAIKDKNKSIEWKVKHSPFYRVERYGCYHLEAFHYNQTSTIQTPINKFTVGISKTKSETFYAKTGVSITSEAGVTVGKGGAKVSATLSVELGWQRSGSITELQQRTLTRPMDISPKTAMALWALSYDLWVKRADGSALNTDISFEVDSLVYSQYPHPKVETFQETPPQQERV